MAVSLARRADVEFGELREVPVTPAAPPTPARPVVTALEGAELIPLSDALHFSQRAGRFVGRTGELETLLASWKRATRGELQLAVVTGDAGLLGVAPSNWTRFVFSFMRRCDGPWNAALRWLPGDHSLAAALGRRVVVSLEDVERGPGRPRFEISDELRQAWGVGTP